MEYKKTRNPTILSVLKEDGTIIFSCGMKFTGRKKLNAIYTSFIDEDTINKEYQLNIEGVNDAMKMMREYEDFLET